MIRFLLLSLAAAGVLAAPSQADQFQSPTHNIGCYIDRSGVRCDIAQHDWPRPVKPPSCEVDYGQGVFVGRRGRASFVCAGDTTLGAGPVLGYGRTIRRGRFRCRSRRSGMRCINRRNGHGFHLSRAVVRRF